MSLSAIRRWHKAWYLPITVGAILLAIGSWWIGTRSAMGRLRASGAPTTFAELVPEPIPDAENGAAVLRDAAEPLADFSAALSDFYQTPAGVALDQLGGLDPTPEETLPALRQFMDEHTAATEVAPNVAARPRYATLLTPAEMSDLQSTLDRVQLTRSAARATHLLQRVQLADGEIDAAAEAAVSTLAFGKALESEPFMTQHLVAVAIQGFGMQQAERLLPFVAESGGFATTLDAALAQTEDRSSLETTLVSERVYSLHALQQMAFPASLWFRSGVLELYEEAIPLCSASPKEMATAARLGLRNQVSLLGGIESLFAADLRIMTQARCLRVAIALARTGGPATAEALGLPGETLVDPFSGQPLQVTRSDAGGWRVESCGPDQRLGRNDPGDDDPADAADNLVIETP